MTESLAPVLFDVNALIALCLTTHQRHRDAHSFLAVTQRWSTCPITEAGLVRLLMNPHLVGVQRSIGDVLAVVAGLRTDPRWSFVSDDTSLTVPSVQTWVLVGHRQLTDLHLVNLARHRGLRLATFDRALPEWLAPADRELVQLIPSA